MKQLAVNPAPGCCYEYSRYFGPISTLTAQSTPIGLPHADKNRGWAALPKLHKHKALIPAGNGTLSRRNRLSGGVCQQISRLRHFLLYRRKLLPSTSRFGRLSSAGGRSGCVCSVPGSRDGGGGFGCRIAAAWGFPLLPLPRHYSQP